MTSKNFSILTQAIKPRRHQSGSSIAEFGPALFFFLLIIAFPLINLLSFGMGYASLYYLTSQCASEASTSSSYTDARTKMQTRATQITSSGIGQFAKLVPIGGSAGTGTDLYITVTDINAKTTQEYGPNTGFVGAVDETNFIYEYTVRATFNVGPFLNLSGIPFIGAIPLIGQAVPVRCFAHRAIEHTSSLSYLPKSQQPLLAFLNEASRFLVK